MKRQQYTGIKQEHTVILAAGFLADLPPSATFDCSQTYTSVLETSIIQSGPRLYP